MFLPGVLLFDCLGIEVPPAVLEINIYEYMRSCSAFTRCTYECLIPRGFDFWVEPL